MSDADARISALEPRRQVLLQAPAGSGKTTVLAQRFLRLLATVDEPEQVLAITFTRKAAAEMRERVLLALEDRLPATQADRAQWRELRDAALRHARERGWDTEELPTRLRIQTIDSLNHELARAMPLLGRMQPSLEVVDDAQSLYLQAAGLALRSATGEPSLQADVDALLLRLDNDWGRAETLLAGLLASRGRWLPVLLDTEPDRLADRIIVSLTRIVEETLHGATTTLPTDLQTEAGLLARSSAAHRHNAADAGEGNWRIWLNETTRLDANCRSLAAWRAIAELALTGAGEWRKPKGINKRQGFPPTDKPLKARWQQWTEALQKHAAYAPLLRTLLSLPDPGVDVTERQALAGLARVLLQAAAQLQLVFRDSGQVDHNEVAAVARLALCDMGEPTDLSLRQTLRVHHLLVDEFQDISPEQKDLIEALMVGWDEEDGRSIFLVGDPMQSIYLFRDSEVGLFLEARTGGIGGRELCSLELRRNFRSVTPLVEWVNNAFRDIFPANEDVRSSAVPYLSAEGVRAGADGAVTIWPQPGNDPGPEARQIAAECARLRSGNPQLRCAILLQTRTAAPPILRALREAGVQAQGVDLAPLSELPVVRDVLSIARALLHAGDRTAWLSVLRAPFCGLTLFDLYQLCGHDPDALLTECLADSSRLAQLSPDGQRRLARCAPLLLKSFEGRRRDHLANCVESLWIQLGGPASCRDAADLGAARQFLLALRKQEQTEPALDSDRLEALAQRLRAGSDGTDSDNVEVLTIHHAKGLEWDAVFVPGLGRRVRSDQPPLLRWLQLPAHGGAHDLLMAVHSIGERVSSDPLSGYIRRLQKERQDNERRRLAYVAATRARERLYLSGHAPWNEELQAPQPDARSQLEILWPAVRGSFLAAAGSVPTTMPSTTTAAPWYRLDAGFTHTPRRRMPDVGSLAAGVLATGTRPEFEWAGPLARAAGTLVHREFELLTLAADPQAVDFSARRSLYVTQLCELGVDQAAARHTAGEVATRLADVVRDANARWLLSAHRSAVSELRLTGVVGGRLRNIVIDRSFIDEKGVRWVIDYKTSTHTGSGLAEFLSSERERYRPQLELYREMARRLGPEPVRAALYFPWLGELLEVA